MQPKTQKPQSNQQKTGNVNRQPPSTAPSNVNRQQPSTATGRPKNPNNQMNIKK